MEPVSNRISTAVNVCECQKGALVACAPTQIKSLPIVVPGRVRHHHWVCWHTTLDHFCCGTSFVGLVGATQCQRWSCWAGVRCTGSALSPSLSFYLFISRFFDAAKCHCFTDSSDSECVSNFHFTGSLVSIRRAFYLQAIFPSFVLIDDVLISEPSLESGREHIQKGASIAIYICIDLLI